MISGREITAGFSLALDLARGVPDWAGRHDMSADRVFGSFWAVPLSVLPALLVARGEQQVIASLEPEAALAVGPGVLALRTLILLVAVWAVELGLLVSLAGRMNGGWRVSPMIIAYNWSSFLVQLCTALALGVGLAIGETGLVVGFLPILFLFSLWLVWGIVRRPLGTTVIGTVAIIFILVFAQGLVQTLFELVFRALGLG